MRLAYWTTDEVNLDLARQWAAALAGDVQPAGFADKAAATAEADAILCDLDSWPQPEQRLLAALLREQAQRRPAAPHGYNLDDALRADLESAGVIVARQLDRELIAALQPVYSVDIDMVAQPAVALG